MRLIKLLIASIILSIIANCTLPFSDKQFIDYTAEIQNAESISIIKNGPMTIFNIETGASPSVMTAIDELKKTNACKELKNIDIEYFHKYYYIVGLPQLVVKADCFKTEGKTK